MDKELFCQEISCRRQEAGNHKIANTSNREKDK